MKPNIRRIEGLAKTIPTLTFDGKPSENSPTGNKKRFSMDSYFHACGTPACIAGYAIAKYGDPKKARRLVQNTWRTYDVIAADLLGLDNYWWATDTLFMPTLGKPLDKVTPKQAVKALAKLAKTIRAGKDYTDLTTDDLWGKL